MSKNYYARSEPGDRPTFAAFDLETRGLGGEVLCASYMMEGMDEPGYIVGGDVIQKLFTIMTEHHDCTWYAHHAQYELRYFTDRLLSRRDDIKLFARTDSDIFMVTIDLPEYAQNEDSRGRELKKPKIPQLVIRDSLALLPRSLRDLAKTFCPELPKLDFDFNRNTFDPHNPEHIEYSKRDSEALLLILTRFDDLLYDEYGVHVRCTTAGTALAAWERTIPKHKRYFNHKESEDFVRSAYFGGLVFLTDTRLHRNVKSYDVSSSYPASMLEFDMPYGRPAVTTLYEADSLGIYDVTLSAPDDVRVPIIPVRLKSGAIAWPAGVFRTTVTSPEINFALKNGYRLLHIHLGMVWEKTVRPFDDFIGSCKKLRKLYKKQALEFIAKLMQNSVYGKFASRRERREYLTDIPVDANDTLTAWGDNFFIQKTTAKNIKCLPLWSVFITARSRLRLLEKIYEVGPENCIYGDTDSITLKEGFTIEEGTEYGQFQNDKTWLTFRARAPKVYSGHRTDPETGLPALYGAAKGIPGRLWHAHTDSSGQARRGALELIYSGENAKLSFDSLETYTQSLKTEFIGTRNVTRKISDLENSVSWGVTEDGDVYPRTVEEIEARQNRGKRVRISDDSTAARSRAA